MESKDETRLLPHRADTDLFDVASAHFKDLLALRTRAEAIVHNEHATPTSVDNMRTYFRELALGAAFVREKLGTEAVPERFVVWGVSPQTSLPPSRKDEESMCGDSRDLILGITPKALVNVGPGYVPKNDDTRISEDYDGRGRLIIGEKSLPYLPSLIIMRMSVEMAQKRGVTTRISDELCAEAVIRWGISGALHNKDGQVTKLNPIELASWYEERAARKRLH